ncbi:hypothetical protein SAMD00079811_19670 [Scytonema sp. HK-05]|uniref:hypothetical protein n=1 Tax=Scytonema sp. HK-05 TaxID=1137095 RepID=UPI000937816D|nr:hypothetical protein [Scytonema sp. HK-05]OKH57695.1 hypothetical protein NIES2130_18425 [Scytonema sp. HK-05]BAY44369.1 hypothetical protein SAMD00079811_19670 [Scytonema sp. HK-05]
MNLKYQKFSKSAKFLGAICGGLLIGLPAISQVAVAQQSAPRQPQQQANSKTNPCPSIFYEEPHNSNVFTPAGCPPNAFTRQSAQQGGVTPGSASVNPTQEQIRQGVGGETPYNRSDSSSQTYNYSSQTQSTSSGQDVNSSESETRTYTSQGPAGGYTVSTNSQSQSNPSTQQRQSSVITPPAPEQRQAPSSIIALRDGRVTVRLVNDTAAPITYQAIGDTAPRTLPGKSEVLLQRLATPTTVTFQRQDNGLLMVRTQPSSQAGVLEVRLDETTDLQMDTKAMSIQQNGQVFLN